MRLKVSPISSLNMLFPCFKPKVLFFNTIAEGRGRKNFPLVSGLISFMAMVWDLRPRENGIWCGISATARVEISVNLGVIPDVVHM